MDATEVYNRVQQAKTLALFYIDYGFVTVGALTDRFDKMFADFPHTLVGVYTRRIKLEEIVEDMEWVVGTPAGHTLNRSKKHGCYTNDGPAPRDVGNHRRAESVGRLGSEQRPRSSIRPARHDATLHGNAGERAYSNIRRG